jgi:hypothetical protein
VEPRTQKSFEFAIDVTRQLLTLSTAILALTVTIARDIQGDADLLVWASGLFLASLVFGIVAIGRNRRLRR